jgi:hypothetical protein
MPRTHSVSIRRTLRKLLPQQAVSEAAKASGAFRRQRKIDPYALVWTLILGFSAGKVRTLASLRRVYQRVTGTTLEESSFYDRFTPALVKMLKVLLVRVIDLSWGIGRQASGRLRQFRDVLIADSTVIRLHNLLAKSYPACRTNHTQAAAKVHLVMCATGAGKQTIKVTPERRHDRRAFVLGPRPRKTSTSSDARPGGRCCSTSRAHPRPAPVVRMSSAILRAAMSRRAIFCETWEARASSCSPRPASPEGPTASSRRLAERLPTRAARASSSAEVRRSRSR